MDDLVKRATYGLEDMQGRVDAGKLAMFADCIDRIEELEAKLAKLRAFLDELWDSQGYDARELHDLLNEMDGE